MNFTLNQVTTALNNSIEQAGGIDAAIEICDRMYSGVWRYSETVGVVEFEENGGDIDHLQHEILYAVFKEQNPEAFDCKPCPYNDEDRYESWCYGIDAQFDSWEFNNKELIKSLEIKQDDRVCCLVNYKGEGEGEAIERLCLSLSIFKDKNSSFNDSIKR